MYSVVITDDSSDIVLLYSRILQLSEQFKIVATASTPEKAVVVCSAQQPNLLILDIFMPGRLTYAEAISKIKFASPKTKILVASAYLRTTMEQRVLDAGADMYLEKGGTAEDLVKACLQVCAIHDIV